MSTVLDASALLAYFKAEPGFELVEAAISSGASIAQVNWAEVLSKLSEWGKDPLSVEKELTRQGLLHGALSVEPLTGEDVIEIARLRPLTRDAGLSLGDRACLALARRLRLPALTADTAWARLGLDIEIRVIR